MDPLAEFVKIDPNRSASEQYRHDVNRTELQQSLEDTFVSCVTLSVLK